MKEISIPAGATDVRIARVIAQVELEFRDGDGEVIGMVTGNTDPIHYPHKTNFGLILDNITGQIRAQIAVSGNGKGPAVMPESAGDKAAKQEV